MKAIIFVSLILLPILSQAAPKFSWVLVEVYETCKYHNGGKIQNDDVSAGHACSIEGATAQNISGTRGYECDPTTVEQFVCCAENQCAGFDDRESFTR